MANIEITTGMLVLPEGMELDDDERNHFALRIEWRGPRGKTGRGGYGVSDGFRYLSRAGNWGNPQAFQQRLYRWETLEEALEMARAHVNSYRMNGKTWAEWRSYWAAREAEKSASKDPS